MLNSAGNRPAIDRGRLMGDPIYSMGMEMLSCKTPEMVQKEIWVHLLAYHLIRMMMLQSALIADIEPRKISFKHFTAVVKLPKSTRSAG